MSRTSAGVLHHCDAPDCTTVAFTPIVEVPAEWARREAGSEGMEGTGRGRIGVDLCGRHTGWQSDHVPLLPGRVQFDIVGDVLILSLDLACVGCDWTLRQRLPTGVPEERDALLTRVWLEHLSLRPVTAASEHTIPLETT